MNRLTTRIDGVAAQAWEHEEQHTTAEWIDLLQERLAAYEDTGLEPEEIRTVQENMAPIPFGRFHDIMQAEWDGRLVVLPCKKDDTLWVAGERRVIKCTIDEVFFDKSGLTFMVSFNCEDDTAGTMNTNDMCDGCPFHSWHQDFSGEYSCNGEWGQASIKGSDFGKKVFLSSEEAEKAVKGGGDHE